MFVFAALHFLQQGAYLYAWNVLVQCRHRMVFGRVTKFCDRSFLRPHRRHVYDTSDA